MALLVAGVVLLRLSRSPELGDPRNGSDEATPGVTEEDPGAEATFSRDEQGAAAAAVSYTATAQRWLYWTDEQITEVWLEMATDEVAERLAAQVVANIRLARDELAKSSGPVWWLVHPLAWEVQRFSPQQATVEVWTMQLLSAADIAVPQTEWVTVVMDLEWQDGTWRLADFREVAGPTPMTGPNDEPWQPEPFDDALEGFTRLDGEPVVPARS